MPRRLAARAALLVAVASTAAVALGRSMPTTVAATRPSTADNVRLPRFPALSPDGSLVAFAWHGDVWLAPTHGGPAHRLTSDPFDDLYPVFSPDGTRVAFTGERLGGGNLFTVRLDGTDLRQVTTTDRYFALYDWAGGQLWASAKLEQEAYPGGRSYAVPDAGGDAVPAFGAFGTTPAVSPDGSKILFTRGAMPWSRRGYRGSDARDVWLYDRAAKTYTRLTDWDGNDGRPRWVDDRPSSTPATARTTRSISTSPASATPPASARCD